MSSQKTAFVTGASRGIGKVIAIWLAKAGFDVVVTARSVNPGELREHSPTASSSDTSPLPGSLSETVAEIRKLGREVLMLPADITDPTSVTKAATTALSQWGAPDVLVNCARHTGPGHMDKLVDTPDWGLRSIMEGNFFTPLLLCKIFAPGMLARGSGVIFNLTSMSAFSDPKTPAGDGGWGVSYGASKAAIHRLAGILAVELPGVLTFNIDPGYTWTERIEQDMAKFGFKAAGRVPPEVTGAAVAWLATEPEAVAFNGRTIFTPQFAADRKLYPGWDLSQIMPIKSRIDRVGASLLEGKAVSD